MIPTFFVPDDSDQLYRAAQQAMTNTQQSLNTLLHIPHDQRTFDNTVRAYDLLVSFSELSNILTVASVLEHVDPRKEIRAACQEVMLTLTSFMNNTLLYNQELYEAICSYAQGPALQENLTTPQQYYLARLLTHFKRAGLNLPHETQKQLVTLEQKVTELSINFAKNIAHDTTIIPFTREELTGLADAWITEKPRTSDGHVNIGLDYPTYFAVLEQCTQPATRKKIYTAFHRRGYPANESVLQEIVGTRSAIARILGYPTYAAFSIADSMAGTVETVESFLHNLWQTTAAKSAEEFALLKADLPDDVIITEQGQLQPWDIAYARNHYAKKHFNVNDNDLINYFPLEETLPRLFAIYEHFLDIMFEEVTPLVSWHPTVRSFNLYSADRVTLLGTLYLDLHPRSYKYPHACHITMRPALKALNEEGKPIPAMSLVIANFPQATETVPSLLHRSREVKTFFHELGHALHALLGRTDIASVSGTSVMIDFVESPSQMFEKWLEQPQILKQISSHYRTGEPLSDQVIADIESSLSFYAANKVQGQILYALFSLACYKTDTLDDPQALYATLQAQICPAIAPDLEARFFASFSHLTGYGASYYSYLYSLVYAEDIFAVIMQKGLYNKATGRAYVGHILSKGGSAHPTELLENFLGRKPSADAFFNHLGIMSEHSPQKSSTSNRSALIS